MKNLSTPEKTTKIIKTIAYYIAFVVLGLRLGSLGPTLPGLAQKTGSTLSEVSVLFVAHALGYLIGSLQAGKLYDRWPGNRVMAVTILALASCTACVSMIFSLQVLIGVFLILGIIEATIDVGGNTLLVWVHGERVGPFLNGLYFWVALGALLSPILVARVLSAGGDVASLYQLLSLLILPGALFLAFAPSPEIRKVTTDASPERANGTIRIALISLFLFLTVGSTVGLDSWIYAYVLGTGLGNEQVAAYITAAFWSTLVLGRLLTIPLVMRLKPSFILYLALIGGLLSSSTILVWSDSLPILIVGVCGLGLSLASIAPTTISQAEQQVSVTGRVTGWFVAGISGGCLLIPWLIGQFFERTGPQVTLIAVFAAILLALGILSISTMLPSSKKGEPNQPC